MKHVLRVLALAIVLLSHQAAFAVPLTIDFDDAPDGVSACRCADGEARFALLCQRIAVDGGRGIGRGARRIQ